MGRLKCVFCSLMATFISWKKNKGRTAFGLLKKIRMSMLSICTELGKLMTKDFQRMVISGTQVTREIKQLFWVLPQKSLEKFAQNSETEAVRDKGVEDYQVF